MATLKPVTVGNIRLTIKYDREYGEWQLRVYVNGKFNEDRSYFGGGGQAGKEDVIATRQFMIMELLAKR